jgi:hypothetical protein
MMTKKNNQVVATIILVVGVYLVYRRMTSTKSGGSSPSFPVKPTETRVPSGVFEYVVATTSGSLNVRPTPATNLAPVAKYEKGRTFYGRESNVSGWVEVVDVSSSFPKVIGYVSAQFAQKK